MNDKEVSIYYFYRAFSFYFTLYNFELTSADSLGKVSVIT